jgi:hypothetical protein
MRCDVIAVTSLCGCYSNCPIGVLRFSIRNGFIMFTSIWYFMSLLLIPAATSSLVQFDYSTTNIGGGQIKMIGIYLQRGILIMSLVAIPCIFANYHVDTILIWLGQQPGTHTVSLPRCSLLVGPYHMKDAEWYHNRGCTIICYVLSMDCTWFTLSNII